MPRKSLRMSKIARILQLRYGAKLSIRAIARQLGLGRSTIIKDTCTGRAVADHLAFDRTDDRGGTAGTSLSFIGSPEA